MHLSFLATASLSVQLNPNICSVFLITPDHSRKEGCSTVPAQKWKQGSFSYNEHLRYYLGY